MPLQKALRAFLFADVRHFSQIPDADLPEFVIAFLNGAANILHAPDSGVTTANTWGDALFAVFEDPCSAAEIALQLRDWSRNGFPSDGRAIIPASDTREAPSLRISLHAGPVLVGIDAVTGHYCHIGQHVVRTARLEPTADAGQILTTEEFAALTVTSTGGDRFRFDYQGLVRLDKDYGRLSAYRLEWAHR